MFTSRIQAIINFASGAWPVLHLKSFEKVTGKKEDEWLVKTIGWLFILSSVQLWKPASPRQQAILGIGWPLVIGGSDVYYGGIKKRISRIYLADAIVQTFILIAWVRVLSCGETTNRSAPRY